MSTVYAKMRTSGVTCNAIAPQDEGIAKAISATSRCSVQDAMGRPTAPARRAINVLSINNRSEEHTSELQSHSDLVCRLLLEKKNDRHGPGPPHLPGADHRRGGGEDHRAGAT